MWEGFEYWGKVGTGCLPASERGVIESGCLSLGNGGIEDRAPTSIPVGGRGIEEWEGCCGGGLPVSVLNT